MKKVFGLLLVLIFPFSLLKAQTSDEKYDSVLAKKLHADEYGMKNYILVLLKPGGNTTVDKITEDSIFHGSPEQHRQACKEWRSCISGPIWRKQIIPGPFYS